MSSTSEMDEPTLVSSWSPSDPDLQLDVGLSGTCNECDEPLERVKGESTRLKCPACGYLAGLIIRMPVLQADGDPGEKTEWPKHNPEWDIDDGRATFDFKMQGKHVGCGDIVNDTAETRFGTADVACDGCEKSLGAAYQINTLVDPINDVNHLD